VLVDNTCGYKIETQNRTEDNVIEDLYLALMDFQQFNISQENLANGAIVRASKHSWCRLVKSNYIS